MGNYQVRFWRAVALVKESLTLIYNAAINILKRGLSTVGHTGTNAWGEGTATSAEETQQGQVRSANQESPSMTSGECQLHPS